MNINFIAQAMSIFEIIMVSFFITTGIYLVLTPLFNYWSEYFRTVFAVVHFDYGSHRSANKFHQYKNKEDKQ
jgi:hypothetical protein